MNQTQEQIDLYSKLVDPKSKEETLKMETRKGLEADRHEAPATPPESFKVGGDGR